MPSAGAPTSKLDRRSRPRWPTCNKDAADKKGDERKAFMKTCLSAKRRRRDAAGQDAACDKSADDKKLAGDARNGRS